MRKYLKTLLNAGKASLGMCLRVLVVTPKKGELKSQQVQHRGVGKGRGKGLILGKELKNIICLSKDVGRGHHGCL